MPDNDLISPDELQQLWANQAQQRNQANQLRIPLPQVPGSGMPPVMWSPSSTPKPSPVAAATASYFNSPLPKPAAPAPAIAQPNVGQAMQGLPPVMPSPQAEAEQKNVANAQERLSNIQNKPAVTTSLWDKAGQIQNPILRPIARVGAGLLRGVESVGNAVVPEFTSVIPGTQLNRAVQIGSAQRNLASAEENQLKGAQSEEAQSRAQQATSQQALMARMAAQGYAPVVDQFGRTSWQYTGKGEQKIVTDDRATIADPNDPTKQIPNPNQGKPVYATLNPQGAVMSYGALAAEPNKQLPPDQQPVTPQRLKQITDEIASDPYLSDAEKKQFTPLAGVSSAEAEKQLADAKERAGEISGKQEHDLANQTRRDQNAQANDFKLQTAKENAAKSYEAILQKNSDKVTNLQEALGMLDDPNGMKDALSVVKTLVATSGGLGSGVRITNAELSRIASARSFQGSIQVAIDHFINGESLSDAQRYQMQQIVQDVATVINRKQSILYDAAASIRNATNLSQINAAQNLADRQIHAMEVGKDMTTSQIESYAQKYLKGDMNAARKQAAREGLVEVPD